MAKVAKEKEKKTKIKKSKTATAVATTLDDMETGVVGFDIGDLMDDQLDLIEKKTKVSSGTAERNAPRVSTGQLALDMFLSGGIVSGGWYTFSGGEQSCKSTLTMAIMASLIKLEYGGISAVFDYEGSTDADYVAGQLKTFGVTVDPRTIFGVRDDTSGDWLIKPRIRYYAPDNGTRFFDWMSSLRRRLPDKIVEKDGTAYMLFENNKENAKKLAGKYDKKWFSRHNQFKVRAPDGHMQAMVIVDSYPAMLPDQLDDDEGSNAMAIQARMFSDGIKRFRGGMRGKMITIVGVNQLRQKPATMFGSPEYEPCGDALKFYCFDATTLIRTNFGVLTAPAIQSMMADGTEVLVETLGGFEPIMKAWRVEEQRTPLELTTAGTSYIGSDQHRQLVFYRDVTDHNEPALRTEFATLSDIQSASGEVYAVMRLSTVDELMEYSHKERNASLRYVNQFLRSDAVNTMINVSEGYQVVAAVLRVGENHVATVISSLLDLGIISYEAANHTVIIPGLSVGTMRTAILDSVTTVENSLIQRSVMLHLAIADAFPELANFVGKYNLAANLHEAAHFGSHYQSDDYAYLADSESMEKALKRLVARDFPEFADQYDEISRQAAYIDDLLSLDENLYPVACSVRAVSEQQPVELWDVTVPATSAVVTNGFVSHNSDVRIRLASRAVPQGWPTLKDERAIVGEKSVTVEGGIDRYRFIAAKTIKNKMGGIPNQQTWLRLWEADGNGEARGFDPVFDTWHYLKTLGLINGMRKKFKIKAPCPIASDKAMDWDQFRTLINGSKAQITEVCKELGVKPGSLRAWCFKFIASEKGQAMLKDSISRSTKQNDDEDED
ncbi:putative RecA protein [Erwinia phage vB_EamM_Yoloswag]|uniref:Putative RecA protein n=1 Tax=Erwinia phage vB_EamM_Yoloswag TaxID=1958956 RepID=A0A1S6L3F1_9CAUD|nr:putative RecA protein [Erwinia phage vB_EamM_Yoloswag]AQT28715.1 putative RecA protein [Erwinia phage vB_EamM_Yoloswag]